MKYIYHHLGLGDHLICNGLVREIINETENYYVLCKPHYANAVSFMYRDLKNIKVIEGYDDYIYRNNLTNQTIFINLNNYEKYDSFEKCFYGNFNLDFNKKYTSFYVQRDEDKENMLYEKFNINEDYIFLHDDASRSFNINLEKIPSNIRIIKPTIGLTDNIFDYIKLIKNAKEVHCIDSSFLHLSDILELNKNLYYHVYARDNYNKSDNGFFKNAIKVI